MLLHFSFGHIWLFLQIAADNDLRLALCLKDIGTDRFGDFDFDRGDPVSCSNGESSRSFGVIIVEGNIFRLCKVSIGLTVMHICIPYYR